MICENCGTSTDRFFLADSTGFGYCALCADQAEAEQWHPGRIVEPEEFALESTLHQWSDADAPAENDCDQCHGRGIRPNGSFCACDTGFALVNRWVADGCPDVSPFSYVAGPTYCAICGMRSEYFQWTPFYGWVCDEAIVASLPR